MNEWSAEQLSGVIAAVIEKAKTDKAFRESLIASPHVAIQAATGQVVPESIKLNVVENNGAHMTIVLPDMKSEADELSEVELTQVAGGQSDWRNPPVGGPGTTTPLGALEKERRESRLFT